MKIIRNFELLGLLHPIKIKQNGKLSATMTSFFKKVLVYLVFAIAFFFIFLLLSKVFNLGYSLPRLLILSIVVSVVVFLKDELSKKILKK